MIVKRRTKRATSTRPDRRMSRVTLYVSLMWIFESR